jgi:hypothetical protein
MFSKRFGALALVFFGLVLSSPVMAQDGGDKKTEVTNKEYNVEISAPEDWEVVEGGDKAIANFKHRGSQSQIEVVATKLMTQDVSDVFFETFHKTLKDSDFKEQNKAAENIGGQSGTLTSYQFKHSGVTLNVEVFEFTRNETAWMVVGYMQDSEAEKRMNDYRTVIENMQFDGG